MSEFGILCDVRGLDFDEAVLRLRDLRPAGIMTFTDYQLGFTARLAAALGLPFHTLETVEALTRKYVQRRLLNSCGASHVATRLIQDESSLRSAFAELGCPGVLKPDMGTGSRSTYRIVDAGDVEEFSARNFAGDAKSESPEQFVLETEIPCAVPDGPWGDYVSVESLILGDRIEHLGICGKFPLSKPYRETGSCFPAALSPTDVAAITDLVTRAIRALGVRHGICHTEVKFSATGLQIIEVNGRLGGRVNELVRQTGGPSVIEIAARLALSDSSAFTMAREWAPQGVSFLYAKVPPFEATRLLDIRGVDDLHDMTGISRAIAQQEPGAAIDWRRGRLEHAYICFGAAGSHEGVLRLVSEIEETVSVTYEVVRSDAVGPEICEK
ncbi:hypothetical protein VT50_0228835 [Streptomyces antioxidans]|uniref:ATP-grasp domain-containing protein n=2 Tax=Streptomyces antioxidans TaxID=1507734 RepID=A0A1V4CXS3_9ACTN|nr:hypothetical protein VT50_0228835 [Streptomyces antioxidans]